MDSKSFPYIAFLGTLWGTNLVVSRFGIGQFDPLLFAGLRLLLSTVAVGLLYALVWRKPWPTNPTLWRHAALLGVFGTAVPMTTALSSLRYQSSGVVALLVTTSPAMIVVMAHFFLPDEPLNRTKLAGVILAMGGAMLLVVNGESGLPDVTKANPIGYALVLGGLLAESGMAIYVRRHMQTLDVRDVTAVRLLSASLAVMPLALLWRGADFSHVDNLGLLSLLYASFAGALLAQLVSFYITRRFGATAFSLTSYVIPIVATGLGVALLGEQITAVMLAGMALIVSGVVLINR